MHTSSSVAIRQVSGADRGHSSPLMEHSERRRADRRRRRYEDGTVLGVDVVTAAISPVGVAAS